MVRTITLVEVVNTGIQTAASQHARVAAVPVTSFANGVQEMLGWNLSSDTTVDTGANEVTRTIVYTYDFAFDLHSRWPTDESLIYAGKNLFGQQFRMQLPSITVEATPVIT